METTKGEAPGLLGRVRIASPCPTSWEAMEGDDRVRFCRLCSLNVYNLSALTRGEAEALVARAEGRLCARFYRRADGTVLTQDCPTGLSAVRRRVRRTAAAVFAAVVSLWTAAAGQTGSPKGAQGKEAVVSCEGGGQLKIRRKPVAAGERASVSGTVLDPAGATLPGVVVTLTNEATKEKASATTNDEGVFSLAPAAPGVYTLRVEPVAGFKWQEVGGIALTAEESLSIESALALSVEGVTIGIVAIDFGPEERNGNGKTVFNSEQILKLPRP